MILILLLTLPPFRAPPFAFRLLITRRRHDLLLLLSFCIIGGDQFNHGPSQSWIMSFTH
jgi:hypothetical protein